MKPQKNKPPFLFIYFVLALFFAGILLGYFSADKKFFPYKILTPIYKQFSESLENTLDARSPALDEVDGNLIQESGVTAHEKERMQEGATLLSGAFKKGLSWSLGARLISSSGDLVHEWVIDPSKIWPNQSKKKLSGSGKALITNSILVPENHLIANVHGFGIVRLDSRSNVVWKFAGNPREFLSIDEEGFLWFSVYAETGQPDQKLPGLRPPFKRDYIRKVNATTGEVTRPRLLQEAFYQSDRIGLLRNRSENVLDVSDVESVPLSAAKQSSRFNEGDLLISIRNLNTVLLLDKNTFQIKWSLTHPFIEPEDIEISDDGKFTVVSYSFDQTPKILKVNPDTEAVEKICCDFAPLKINHKADRKSLNSHQILSNGNILFTHSALGKIEEFTPTGETVWAWQAPSWRRNKIAPIFSGTRVEA